jgi:hypothetical protein
MKNSEAVDKLNKDLLDLVNSKVDFFMNNVKQLVGTTSKIVKFVQIKTPEVE